MTPHESPSAEGAPTVTSALIRVRVVGLDDVGIACTALELRRGEDTVVSAPLSGGANDGEGVLLVLPPGDADSLAIMGSPDGHCPWDSGSFQDIDPNRVPLEGSELVLRFLQRPVESRDATGDMAPATPGPGP